MIEGVIVKMGGKEWTVPPLTLKQIRKLGPRLATLNEGNALDEAYLDLSVELVHAALARNYPDITKDEVEDVLDMRNFREVVQVIMGKSGFVSSGEAQPGAAIP